MIFLKCKCVWIVSILIISVIMCCVPVYSSVKGVLLYSDESNAYLCNCTVNDGIISFDDYDFLQEPYVSSYFLKLSGVDVDKYLSGSIVTVYYECSKSLFHYFFGYRKTDSNIIVCRIVVNDVLSDSDYGVLLVYPSIRCLFESHALPSGMKVPDREF